MPTAFTQPMGQSDTSNAPLGAYEIHDVDSSVSLPRSPRSMRRRGSCDMSVPSSPVERHSGLFDEPLPPNTPSADLVPLDLSWVRNASPQETGDSESDKEDVAVDEDNISRPSSRSSLHTIHVYGPFGSSTPEPAFHHDDPRHTPPPPSLPELVIELHRILNATIPGFLPDLDALDIEDELLMHRPHESFVDMLWDEIDEKAETREEKEQDYEEELTATMVDALVVNYIQESEEWEVEIMKKTVLDTILEEEEYEDIIVYSKVRSVTLSRRCSSADPHSVRKMI
ncbi:hypothetical protein OF83DRAFT_913217 [Amylostereum chailletii]|nr:hypothetical protein OF83DRAFT_913217 [Amylostereum chailletii]